MDTGAVSRRIFVRGMAGAASALAMEGPAPLWGASKDDGFSLVERVDRRRILAEAEHCLIEEPVTVTASRSARSHGGEHDYFSEGDYWWPDPRHPGGPYMRRDGYSNPENFNTHREALIRLGRIGPALAAGWRLTRSPQFANQLMKHLNAWFVNRATKMNPNLDYAQAIFGVTPGRGVGLIDTLQIVELVRGLRVMEAAHGFTTEQLDPVRSWFADYARWMVNSKNGKEEEAAKNNHGTCWVLQMAEFSQFARLGELTALCRERFKTTLVPQQIAADGSLPLELARTKPYSYSLFDADVLSGICQSLSTAQDDLWSFRGPKGSGVGDVVTFLYPYLANKAMWPFARDVEYFDDLPGRRPCLLFAGEALGRPKFLDLWKRLDPDPKIPEIIRNFPIRQPVLWVDPVLAG